jgi:hypothetical protein
MSAATATPANRIADNGESGGLIRRSEVGAISVFDRINNPMEFVTTMGKALAQSGVGGAKTQAQGECLAFACLCKRMDPFEFSANYHLIDGKPQLQAHAILARMKRAGAKVRWIKDGEDLIEASAEFDIEGTKTTISYTAENAKRAQVVKKDSAWDKTPAAMLRAAMTRKAAKMLMPEILVGDVDPEEFASDEQSAAVSVAPVRTAEEVAKRREELLAMETTSAVSSAATVDAAVAPASAPPTVITGDSAGDLTTLLMEIEGTIGELGMPKEKLEQAMKAKDPAVDSLDKLSVEGAQTLLGNLRAKLAQKK